MNTSQNNSAQNSEQIQPNTSAIKFTHAANGAIDFNSGATVFSDLLMIGAFASTKTSKYNSEALWYEYATDIAGLKSLELKSGEVIRTIADTISSLGMMLAYVDRGEVGDKHLSNHAWLVAGLGELLSQLVMENQEIVHSLLVFSKQANVIPFSLAEQPKSNA
ncbi:MAG: hypothetical protein Q7T96_09875 [Methylobacter sp.]|nr:hypothetical protein [Methylobacter sp.]